MTTLKIPEQKVILCGEYGVGKSSLFRRFTSNIYTTATDRQSTLGLDHYSKRYHVAGKDLKASGDFILSLCTELLINVFSYPCIASTVGHWRNGKSCFNNIKLL
jgi:GTPase SAR1 family protein